MRACSLGWLFGAKFTIALNSAEQEISKSAANAVKC